ncbi:MAG: purine-nucleoside phosphorylase [Gemmatimonadetes bacterium]|nr:purine-nucleoside phosphorylase [Gemmatimonadota bacterium]NNF12574.1 purine-nucleoside phosphorylase [Gemmatimonadota bacterium]
MSQDLRHRVDECAEAIKGRPGARPTVGIVLGTGLGALADMIDVETTIPYEELPGFPVPTVESHSGRLVLGTLGGTPVVAMQGRFHRYEGYTLQEVTFPVRVLKRVGAETLVVSNVSGGMNPLWSVGELVLIDDHINLLGDSPLIGPNDEDFGPRFPDMSEPYDIGLQEMALEAALELNIRLNRGVYVAVSGPQLETRAEYRMLRGLGADVVGMSTVPEVIVARHMSMRVLGLSIITDACLPDALEPVDVSAIIAAAAEAEPQLTRLIERVVSRI